MHQFSAIALHASSIIYGFIIDMIYMIYLVYMICFSLLMALQIVVASAPVKSESWVRVWQEATLCCLNYKVMFGNVATWCKRSRIMIVFR